jgi:prepilin-type N-terminal cleavage/methylation domain-containing protein
MIVRQHHRARRNGLSLLEVLVALAIFLMSLVALGQLISLGGDMARDVQWMSRSLMLAQSRMAELIAGSLPLSSVAETPCDEDTDFSWSVDAQTGATQGIYQVTVTISRPRPDGSKFETSINQFILDPTIRGTTDGSDNSGTTTSTTGSTTSGSTTGGGP